VVLYGDRVGRLGDGSRGARVRDVMPGAPADRAGLKPGDVITTVADAPIHSSDTLMLAVSKQPPLATTPIRFVRDGREQSARVELSKAQPHGEQIVTALVRSWRGLRVDYATAVEGYATAVGQRGTDVRGCVAIRHVEPHSAAWKAGLRAGTFISHVAYRHVRSPDEFYEAVERQSGDVMLRTPLPQNESQQVTVKES
jgi:serine protease Do